MDGISNSHFVLCIGGQKIKNKTNFYSAVEDGTLNVFAVVIPYVTGVWETQKYFFPNSTYRCISNLTGLSSKDWSIPRTKPPKWGVWCLQFNANHSITCCCRVQLWCGTCCDDSAHKHVDLLQQDTETAPQAAPHFPTPATLIQTHSLNTWEENNLSTMLQVFIKPYIWTSQSFLPGQLESFAKAGLNSKWNLPEVVKFLSYFCFASSFRSCRAMWKSSPALETPRLSGSAPVVLRLWTKIYFESLCQLPNMLQTFPPVDLRVKHLWL